MPARDLPGYPVVDLGLNPGNASWPKRYWLWKLRCFDSVVHPAFTDSDLCRNVVKPNERDLLLMASTINSNYLRHWIGGCGIFYIFSTEMPV